MQPENPSPQQPTVNPQATLPVPSGQWRPGRLLIALVVMVGVITTAWILYK